MKIYIKHEDTIVEIIAFILFFVFWIAATAVSFVVIKVIMFFLSMAVFVFLIKYPFFITVTVDDKVLQYKKFFSNVSIPLDSIYYIHCEPYAYKRNFWYRFNENRIRLTIITDDGVTRQLNDILDAQALANDRLHNTHTDIPLIKLSEYLKEQINYSVE